MAAAPYWQHPLSGSPKVSFSFPLGLLLMNLRKTLPQETQLLRSNPEILLLKLSTVQSNSIQSKLGLSRH